MPVLIDAPGTYTVIPGETYIIDPSVSGIIEFVPPSTAGTNDFTVELDSSTDSAMVISFNGSDPLSPLAPTVNVAEGATASNVNFINSGTIESLDYNLGNSSAIGMLSGVDGTDPNEVKTTVTGGDHVTIGGFNNADSSSISASKSVITLGDNATITGPIEADYGGLDLTAGDNFEYTAGVNLSFDFTVGDCSVTLGANADTHGQSFSMGNSGPNYSVEVGDGSDIGHILMGGGSGDKSVILGENVNTGDISIGGSGLADDHMQITLVAGNGTYIGGTTGMVGNIGLGGTFVDRTITFGDDVHVGGLLGMGGMFGTNTVAIGDRYTQDGRFTGSTIMGSDYVIIGDDWQFNDSFTLQDGDDTLQIGATTRDTTSGSVLGGLGVDALTIIVPDDELAAFDTAATNAGWTNNGDGTYNPNGLPLLWKNTTYYDWESAQRVPCFTAGTLILTAHGEVPIEQVSVGDLVQTRDNGLQPVRWIGSQKLGAAQLSSAPKLQPIRIKAGALGPDAPRQDLLVSPQHRVLVRSKIAQKMFGASEVLVAAKQLLQLDGFDIATDVDEVTYFHMLFDRHEVVVSNGAETESLYTGPEALKSVGKAAVEEIFALFPQLADPDHVPEPARFLPSGRQARKLGLRHLQNHRQLVMNV
ncbi:Hint domain-containing protein [Paracoccus methylovorus]|uniref:Hint domain-containing protein n=2 Tax=Paracoccus TaxID=265 RepID=UPI001F06E0F7|nr:Hint domain-containing protein [Paracoccus methylovorus]